MIQVPGQQDNPFANRINALFSFIQTAPMRDLRIAEYWLDKFEVTNKQFKEFMNRGAYETKKYWKYPFSEDGHPTLVAAIVTVG